MLHNNMQIHNHNYVQVQSENPPAGSTLLIGHPNILIAELGAWKYRVDLKSLIAFNKMDLHQKLQTTSGSLQLLYRHDKTCPSKTWVRKQKGYFAVQFQHFSYRSIWILHHQMFQKITVTSIKLLKYLYVCFAQRSQWVIMECRSNVFCPFIVDAPYI